MYIEKRIEIFTFQYLNSKFKIYLQILNFTF